MNRNTQSTHAGTIAHGWINLVLLQCVVELMDAFGFGERLTHYDTRAQFMDVLSPDPDVSAFEFFDQEIA